MITSRQQIEKTICYLEANLCSDYFIDLGAIDGYIDDGNNTEANLYSFYRSLLRKSVNNTMQMIDVESMSAVDKIKDLDKQLFEKYKQGYKQGQTRRFMKDLLV